ncbi:hypothetical protein Tco_0320297 [Tanacetum coccineum]
MLDLYNQEINRLYTIVIRTRVLLVQFPVIVYEDALTSEQEVSPKPTISPHHVKKVDLEFGISFAESDDEDYTVMYDKDSFSYKIIFANDLMLDTDNDDGKIDVKLSLENIFIGPLDSVIDTNLDTYSHAFENFETNHDKPNMALPPRGERYLWLRFDAHAYLDGNIQDFKDRLARIYDRQAESLREIASKADLYDYWTGISFVSDFLSTVPSYTLIREPLRSMDEVATVNVLYLLAYYLFRHASGRKHGARMSGEVRELTTIDIDEMVRLRICNRLGDVVTWVAMGPERQQVGDVAGDAHVDPEAAAPAPRRVGDRLKILKEEVHRLGESIGEQRVAMERLSSDFVSFSTWMITRMTHLMDQSSLGYMRFDGSIASSSHVPYQRRTRQRTNDAGTSAPQQTQDQPDP